MSIPIQPFAYNTGAPISGTTQYGDIVLGNIDVDYSSDYGGVKWWGGPEDFSGYVIGTSNPSGQPVPSGVTGTANVGFWRSKFRTDESFLDLANYLGGKVGQPPFATTNDAEIWLESNGYYTSFNLPTPTPTSTMAPTPTPTQTPTVTATQTQTPTPSVTPTQTQTPTLTQTSTSTQTPTNTPTQTPSVTATQTQTLTPSNTQTPTNTTTSTPTPTVTSATAIKVLILGDSTAPTVGSNLSTYLSATGHPITYSAVTMGTTYTGSGNITKANYDVVLLYTNASDVGTSTLASALTSYVNSGGNLVSGVFLWNLYPSGYNFTGTTAFNVTNGQSNDATGNFTVNVASTITNGIGTTLGGFTLTNGSPSLVAGSTLLASYSSNSAPLVAVRQVGSSTLVSLNTTPSSINTSTSTVCKLVGNSIIYASGVLNPTPTPTATPTQTPTNTPTPSITASQTPTNTPTVSSTVTRTPTQTQTQTPTPTRPAFTYYRWQITQTKVSPPDAGAVQAAEFVFQIGGVDQSMAGVTVTNPGGSNPVGETPPNLVDNNLTTKALDANFVSNGSITNFIFQFSSAKSFNGYRWATANDFEDRDPKSWTIAGSNNGTTWTTLSTVSNFTATVARNTWQTAQTY